MKLHRVAGSATPTEGLVSMQSEDPGEGPLRKPSERKLSEENKENYA